MNEVVIFDASHSADVTVPPDEQHLNLNFNWFCLRAGETLPLGIIMTDAVSVPCTYLCASVCCSELCSYNHAAFHDTRVIILAQD